MLKASNITFFLLAIYASCTNASILGSSQEPTVFPLVFKNIQDPDSDCDIFFGRIYNITNNQSDVPIPPNAPPTLSEDITNFAELSGHSFNDVGFTDLCRSKDPSPNYLFMELTSRSVNTP